MELELRALTEQHREVSVWTKQHCSISYSCVLHVLAIARVYARDLCNVLHRSSREQSGLRAEYNTVYVAIDPNHICFIEVAVGIAPFVNLVDLVIVTCFLLNVN